MSFRITNLIATICDNPNCCAEIPKGADAFRLEDIIVCSEQCAEYMTDFYEEIDEEMAQLKEL